MGDQVLLDEIDDLKEVVDNLKQDINDLKDESDKKIEDLTAAADHGACNNSVFQNTRLSPLLHSDRHPDPPLLCIRTALRKLGHPPEQTLADLPGVSANVVALRRRSKGIGPHSLQDKLRRTWKKREIALQGKHFHRAGINQTGLVWINKPKMQFGTTSDQEPQAAVGPHPRPQGTSAFRAQST